MIRPGKNTCGRGVPHQKAMVQYGGSPGQTPPRKGVSHNWVSSCLVSPSLVSGAMKAYRHYYNRNTATHTTIYTWGLQVRYTDMYGFGFGYEGILDGIKNTSQPKYSFYEHSVSFSSFANYLLLEN